MSENYYNPKLRINILKDDVDVKDTEQGTLVFVKNGKDSIAHIYISDNVKYPILPVWDSID